MRKVLYTLAIMMSLTFMSCNSSTTEETLSTDTTSVVSEVMPTPVDVTVTVDSTITSTDTATTATN